MEIMAVIAIMSVVTAITMPAFTNLTGPAKASRAIRDLALTLTMARSYAMANNTYTYVGIQETDSSVPSTTYPQPAGVGRVWVSVIASRDGTCGYDPSNAASSWSSAYGTGGNFREIRPVQVFEQLHVAQSIPVPATGNMLRPSVDSSYTLGNATFVSQTPFSYPLGATSTRCKFTKVIQFDARGVATVRTNATNGALGEWLEIGLQTVRNNTAPNAPTNANIGSHAVIQLEGTTGAVRVYQP
jgi:Tfp pilus assembly protein FimT